MKKISIEYSFFKDQLSDDLTAFLALIQNITFQLNHPEKDLLYLAIHELVINSFTEMSSFFELKTFVLFFDIYEEGNYVKITVVDQGSGLEHIKMSELIKETFGEKNQSLNERGRGLKLVYEIADHFTINIEKNKNYFIIEKGLANEK